MPYGWLTSQGSLGPWILPLQGTQHLWTEGCPVPMGQHPGALGEAMVGYGCQGDSGSVDRLIRKILQILSKILGARVG